MTSSDEFKDALRVVFDSQIPNYGDYNLVYASNGLRRDDPGHRQRTAKHYVVGYRWQPVEIVVAPFNGGTLTPGSDPTEINMTNLSHAIVLPDGDYEVGTSTGKTFRFGVEPVSCIPAGQRADEPPADGTDVATVDQSEDHQDFVAFMTAFVEMS